MKSPPPAFLICTSSLHWPPRMMEQALHPKTPDIKKRCPSVCVCPHTPESLDSRNTPDRQLHEWLPSASVFFFGLGKNFVCCSPAPICCAEVLLIKVLESTASSTPLCGLLLLGEGPLRKAHPFQILMPGWGRGRYCT